MTIVLDTNVVVSGVFFGGVPHAIMEAWRQGRFEIAATPSILEEYTRVILEMGARIDAPAVPRIIDALIAHSILIDEQPNPAKMCRDPDDDKFLACAAGAHAILISGDKNLLAADGALGVCVLTARMFLARLDRAK